MQLNVRDIANLFEVDERTVYRWMNEDALPAHEVDGESRFHRAEVLEWATARDLTPAPGLFELAATAAETSIATALERGAIHLGLPSSTRDVALAALAERLPLVPADRQAVLEVLRARPDVGKTGLAPGVAIPHVRQPIVLDVEVASLTLCIFDQPLAVERAGPRDERVHAVFVLVTPSVRTHLVMLSRLAFALHSDAVRAALASSEPAAILAALRALESESESGGAHTASSPEANRA